MWSRANTLGRPSVDWIKQCGVDMGLETDFSVERERADVASVLEILVEDGDTGGGYRPES